ncbi:MAG: AAA family ATPase, partial [Actinomycetota bacterium]|nr:AAA family ATPase [Actinomycetota bacterium]
APITHEDDAERAVRAALALPPALAAIDPSLVLKVGVNTGEVLAGPVGPGQGYTVTGDAVNTAHRLVSAAGPGDVLVGALTHAATEGAVQYFARGSFTLRGKQEPVDAWVAERMLAGPGRRWRPGMALPLVGRESELTDLESLAADTVCTSRTTVLTITGEPGVGKTRLAMELAGRPAARQGMAVLWASCPPYGSANALAPVVDLVADGLGIDAAAPRADQTDQLRSRLADIAPATGSDSTRLLARISQLLGLFELPARPAESEAGPTRARIIDQLLGAVGSVLRGLAAERPLLVVLDDLQWANEAVIAFIRQLPERVADVPMLVLALARDDLLERIPALAGSGPGHLAVSLDPLDRQAGIRLIGVVLQSREGPTAPSHEDPPRLGPSAEQRILDAAGGNPLLLEQLVHFLVETHALIDAEGRWRADPELDMSALPAGVRSLIGARLDALPPAERDVIQYAAVIGRRFWSDAVRELGRQREVDEALEHLVQRGLADRVASDDSLGDLAFRHVLTRDVAYAALPISERAERHAAVAGWIRGRFPDSLGGPVIGLLAHHYERALMLSRELDHTDPGLQGAAFTALVAAARDAARHDLLHDADRWYSRARGLGSFDAEAALDVAFEHGGVELGLRRLQDADSTFGEVRRLAVDHRPDLAAHATAHLGAIARLRGDTDRARELFTDAHARWRVLADPAGEVATLRLEGWSELTVGRSRAALPRLLQALAMQRRLGDDRLAGEILRNLAWCEFQAGDVVGAQEHLWEAATSLSATGRYGEVGWCLGVLGFTLLQAGQTAVAFDIAVTLRTSMQIQGDPWSEWLCAVLEAACRLAVGEVGAAGALATAALRAFDELGDAWGCAMAQLLRGMAARAVGDVDLARTALLDGLGSVERAPYVGEEARLLVELAGVDADAGATDDARRRARAALALVRAGIGDHGSGLRALTTLATVERQGGDPAAAELLLDEAVDDVDPANRTDAWRQAAAALAELLVERGALERASALLDETETPPSDGVRTRIAIARGRAALLSALGRPAEGTSLLAEATGSALTTGMPLPDTGERPTLRPR